ncbi:nucleoside 2-deoxyribosyltransferase [Liquorilactobacillus satsumensis]|uniref:nucleoside 2-deoxyribosyltransferase n=1 Tax=Liquorilactobacillus satsumensis TaxID=259059 RepID=UPI001E3322E3|nr:nucleoside 2-deoxyribosyltransferase [Liquorilactobacillus satsumensis]MCC7666080.1 nucleoside 2-deoxyribosyltransferase [Liquorilactobacillus satsumensis]MCP9356813.1 nucleoside 2-deoxyribosyltransferase [Liquorilactobacillus satsumensis]MCP9370753.1 nucleoside 2-deoxyribosyltransferase [Liquorilactobacillus satsumensis]
MNKVYLAAPFFSEPQNQRIQAVKKALQQNKTIDSGNIFLPQEHQFEEEEFGSRAWQQYVFASDMRQVHRADLLVAIIDYKLEGGENESDSGTIFEIGAAFENKTPIVIVQFDPQKKLNLMIAQSLTAYFDASGDGLKELATYNFDVLKSKPAHREVF